MTGDLKAMLDVMDLRSLFFSFFLLLIFHLISQACINIYCSLS